MLIYWLLFGFAALAVLANRPGAPQTKRSRTNTRTAVIGFALFYVVVGGLRYETGGDWLTYGWMYTQISYVPFGEALDYTDFLFGLLNWVSAQLGLGVYLVNAVVCAVLVTGVIRVASAMRDPWLAILIAVPYILIVIGFGYLRQAAAIGMVLLAIHAFGKEKWPRAVLYMALAVGFHSTAILMAPLFVASLSRRFTIYAILLTALAGYAYLALFEPRIQAFQSGYIDQGYQSQGALVRLLMIALPAMLLLARWRSLPITGPVRTFWLLVAAASLALLGAYFVVPSSTAVDRVALYFSVIQIVAFGELISLFNFKDRDAGYVRLVAIGLAGAIQVVWLVYATHSIYWVPYKSILETV